MRRHDAFFIYPDHGELNPNTRLGINSNTTKEELEKIASVEKDRFEEEYGINVLKIFKYLSWSKAICSKRYY